MASGQFMVCSLVVPVFINHPSLYAIVERFFESLKEHYPDLVIVSVDDASPLPHEFPNVLQNDKNQGFTATVNKGLKYAFHVLRSDVVIVANDDLVFKKGDLDRFFELKGRVIASPRDTASDDTDSFGAIWGMTRQAYDILGPLDEQYRHYMSDVDYYQRAKEKGVTVIKWNDITIEHVESGTYKHLDKAQLLEEDRLKWPIK